MRIDAHDPDHAAELLRQQTGYQVRMRPLLLGSPFRFSVEAARLGEISVSHTAFSAPTRTAASEIPRYHLNFPLKGAFSTHHRLPGGCTESSPDSLWLHAPQVPAAATSRRETELRTFSIPPDLVHARLEALLERTAGRLAINKPVDLRSPEGKTLRRLAAVLAAEACEPAPSYSQALATSLSESFITALLYAVPHQYTDRLHSPVPRLSPRSLKRAIDAIEDHPIHPFTLEELATIAGVGSRALQMAFKHHRGISPMQYLQQVRLERAHSELMSAPAGRTVQQIAERWHMTNSGRFAALIRQRYGKNPADILGQGN
ncbi:AraC family transcriptional regulator [Streptomyces sp. NPDC048330]|uniref:AraC family transcriptional regulator n=1 Tax=Streptomyces sp. NPDC048330 TaxID=3365533 RepID=UPI0037156CB1